MNDAIHLPVLVPAPSGSAGSLIARLREWGLIVDHSPFLELRAQRDSDTRDAVAALAGSRFAQLVVDSPRAVEVLASYDGSPESGTEIVFTVPTGVEVIAVGEETAAALPEHGVAVGRVVADVSSIARELPPATAKEALLLVGGAALGPALPRELAATGRTVMTAVVYRERSVSLEPQLVRDLRLHGYGAIVLTSPRIADLAGHLGIHRDIRVVTRDAETTARAQARKLVVHGEASEPSETALADAVLQALETEIVHGLGD